jgi:hypothetical protein
LTAQTWQKFTARQSSRLKNQDFSSDSLFGDHGTESPLLRILMKKAERPAACVIGAVARALKQQKRANAAR